MKSKQLHMESSVNVKTSFWGGIQTESIKRELEQRIEMRNNPNCELANFCCCRLFLEFWTVFIAFFMQIYFENPRQIQPNRSRGERRNWMKSRLFATDIFGKDHGLMVFAVIQDLDRSKSRSDPGWRWLQIFEVTRLKRNIEWDVPWNDLLFSSSHYLQKKSSSGRKAEKASVPCWEEQPQEKKILTLIRTKRHLGNCQKLCQVFLALGCSTGRLFLTWTLGMCCPPNRDKQQLMFTDVL